MQTSTESVSPVALRLVADFSGEETQAAFDEAYKAFARQTIVPGFRPGKAPKALILRKIGKDVRAYARETLLSRGLSAAAKECGKAILGESDADIPEFKEGEPIRLSLVAHVEPEIASLPSYDGLELDCPADEKPVSEIVDESVRDLLDRAGKFDDAPAADCALAMKDMAQVSFDATFEGKPLLEVAPNAKEIAHSDGMWTLLDETYAPLPEFVPALVGMKVGEEKLVTCTFPGKFAEEALRDKAIDFRVKVLKIRRHVPAEMNEEFFKRIGVKDEAEVRANYTSIFAAQSLDALRAAHRRAIVAALLPSLPEAPRPRVLHANRMVMEEILFSLARSRAPADVLRKRFAALQPWMEDIAGKAAGLVTLLLAVARAENIAPAHNAVHARMELGARTYGHGTVKAWLKHLGISHESLERIVEEELASEMALLHISRHARFTGERAADAADLYAEGKAALPPFGAITIPLEMLDPAPAASGDAGADA
ncbi:MAG: trigger factor [Kiritimatiellae bacterium]|nr:trigger factor [Kiritimatiellia bacterium]